MISKHSRDSLRRFVEFMLGLETPKFMFHQTLTFSPPELDAKAAKVKLNRLLDNRFIKGAVYSEEIQRNGGIHYQLLLFYYEKHELPFPTSKMLEGVRAAVFAAWNRYNGGRLARVANVLKQHKFNSISIEYLAKAAKYRDKRAPGMPNWWGKRKEKFLARRSTPPTKKEVARIMKQLLPSIPFLPLGLRCSMRALMREKRDYIEVSFGDANEWERAKRDETGRTDVVSDAELLAFRKARAAEWRRMQRAAIAKA